LVLRDVHESDRRGVLAPLGAVGAIRKGAGHERLRLRMAKSSARNASPRCVGHVNRRERRACDPPLPRVALGSPAPAYVSFPLTFPLFDRRLRSRLDQPRHVQVDNASNHRSRRSDAGCRSISTDRRLPHRYGPCVFSPITKRNRTPDASRRRGPELRLLRRFTQQRTKMP